MPCDKQVSCLIIIVFVAFCSWVAGNISAELKLYHRHCAKFEDDIGAYHKCREEFQK